MQANLADLTFCCASVDTCMYYLKSLYVDIWIICRTKVTHVYLNLINIFNLLKGRASVSWRNHVSQKANLSFQFRWRWPATSKGIFEIFFILWIICGTISMQSSGYCNIATPKKKRNYKSFSETAYIFLRLPPYIHF
jgi:hypothetical protein